MADSDIAAKIAGFNLLEPTPVAVELDEMWHYLHSKKLWFWKAYCRATGQLIDWGCGDRGQANLKRLPGRLRRRQIWLCFTDHWKVL